MRSFISLTETTADDVTGIVERAVKFGGGPARDTTLRERSVGIYFRRTSTRTRTAFTMAAVAYRRRSHRRGYGRGPRGGGRRVAGALA